MFTSNKKLLSVFFFTLFFTILQIPTALAEDIPFSENLGELHEGKAGWILVQPGEYQLPTAFPEDIRVSVEFINVTPMEMSEHDSQAIVRDFGPGETIHLGANQRALIVVDNPEDWTALTITRNEIDAADVTEYDHRETIPTEDTMSSHHTQPYETSQPPSTIEEDDFVIVGAETLLKEKLDNINKQITALQSTIDSESDEIKTLELQLQMKRLERQRTEIIAEAHTQRVAQTKTAELQRAAQDMEKRKETIDKDTRALKEKETQKITLQEKLAKLQGSETKKNATAAKILKDYLEKLKRLRTQTASELAPLELEDLSLLDSHLQTEAISYEELLMQQQEALEQLETEIAQEHERLAPIIERYRADEESLARQQSELGIASSSSAPTDSRGFLNMLPRLPDLRLEIDLSRHSTRAQPPVTLEGRRWSFIRPWTWFGGRRSPQEDTITSGNHTATNPPLSDPTQFAPFFYQGGDGSSSIQ